MDQYSVNYGSGYSDTTNPNFQSAATTTQVETKSKFDWNNALNTAIGVFGNVFGQTQAVTTPGGVQSQQELTANYNGQPADNTTKYLMYGGITLVVVAILYVVLRKN